MNTQELLEKYFDVAFAATDGIKKLRELILSLAMQGKLVPQDPNDQPARELLQEIEAEKERLVKEGKIKQSKPLPEIKPDEIPYDLPKGWEWVRLGEIATQITDGVHQTPKYLDSGIPFISIKDINGKTVSFNDCKYISQEEHKQINLRCNPERGDLLICRIGTLGRATIVDTDKAFSLFVSVGLLKFPQHLLIPTFTHRILNSPFLIRQYDQIKAGGSHTNKLNLGDIPKLIFSLPPLAEQRRIVAKIDELMGRCDELEKLRSDRTQKQITVHTAALDRLLNAKEQNDFNTAWQFLTQHFSELYSTKENIAELRKAILQLAVMGKLVPQDPLDQPSNELLQEIEKEKYRLIKEGKIKKSKPILEINPEELSYNLPKDWEWVRLGNLAISIEYGTSIKSDDDSSKTPVYRMGNIVDGQLINRNFKYVSPEIDDLPRLYLRKNDILFNRTNSYELVGKTAIYLGQDNKATFASYLIRIRLTENHILPNYINLAMNAPYFRKTQIEPEIVQQCGQANFNGSKLSTTLIPLPPLAEQHRIVAKIDQLMTLCDNLEKQIDIASSKQTNLLNALIARV